MTAAPCLLSASSRSGSSAWVRHYRGRPTVGHRQCAIGLGLGHRVSPVSRRPGQGVASTCTPECAKDLLEENDLRRQHVQGDRQAQAHRDGCRRSTTMIFSIIMSLTADLTRNVERCRFCTRRSCSVSSSAVAGFTGSRARRPRPSAQAPGPSSSSKRTSSSTRGDEGLRSPTARKWSPSARTPRRAC